MLSWSGGKDSAWALHVLRQRGDIEVVALLTTLTQGYDRVSMQGIRRDVLHAQAQATGLPLIEAWIPQQADNSSYETSFANALSEAQSRWPGIRDIAFGDLFLVDIRSWRESLCAQLDWNPHFPIFDSDTTRLGHEMIAGGLRAHLCCVDTTQLDGEFSGRAFDTALLDDLPAACDPCGERGEFHTVVSAGPMFDHPIALERGDSVQRDERFNYTDFLRAG
ncbi:ATP-binding protein [Solilutibacter silvestris]|uniref:Dph6-related ATP pyrophosphatase n=1 Tax=Solilutibacter silvestris TaxID=1645665 RepID=UPI003D33391A